MKVSRCNDPRDRRRSLGSNPKQRLVGEPLTYLRIVAIPVLSADDGHGRLECAPPNAASSGPVPKIGRS
jgi:hypothetical protein